MAERHLELAIKKGRRIILDAKLCSEKHMMTQKVRDRSGGVTFIEVFLCLVICVLPVFAIIGSVNQKKSTRRTPCCTT